jgi:hypothetical protein
MKQYFPLGAIEPKEQNLVTQIIKAHERHQPQVQLDGQDEG